MSFNHTLCSYTYLSQCVHSGDCRHSFPCSFVLFGCYLVPVLVTETASVLFLSLTPSFYHWVFNSLPPLSLFPLLWRLLSHGVSQLVCCPDRQAGSSNYHPKLEMPRPDNWSCLVPLWLSPIASLTLVFIFYGFVSTNVAVVPHNGDLGREL